MKKYFSEMLATFALMIAGTGSVIINNETAGALTHLGISLSFGFVVIAMIYAVGEVSGAHMNPAVTIAFWLAGRFPVRNLLPFIIAQCTGALAGSLVLKLLFPSDEMLGATIPAGSGLESFILEFLLSLALMYVIITVSSGSKELGTYAGVAIGTTVFLEAFFAGPISGASMNPARSLGPAIVSGHIEYLWIYIVATTAGMAAAVPLWNLLNKKEK